MKNRTKRRICVISGTRSEFGLLTPLLTEIQKDIDLQLQLIVTGMHLSPEFGYTYTEIEKLFPINKKIEILLSSDSAIGVSKAMGLAQISLAEAYEELNPDIIVVLGDRFEIFAAVSAAVMARIPIAHISGGELTEGAIDDALRHAITKMSHLHFVATEEYRNRVLQLGETPERVFNFGELGLDNIQNLKLLSKKDFEKSIELKLDERNLLITYHPETLNNEAQIRSDFSNLLSVLDSFKKTKLIFTKANSDAGGRMINQMIVDYVDANPQKSKYFTSLGQLRYLSALQYVDAVVGNTSSGIVEAPSFKIGTINIGDRQKGRIQAESVINTATDKASILKGFKRLYSSEFKKKLSVVNNPYWQGGTAIKTINVLKKFNLEGITKKTFYDIPSETEE